MSLTTTRQAVSAALATALGVPFVEGKINPPVERGDVGCTWSPGKAELSGNVDLEQATIMVRVLSSTQRRRGAKDPKPTVKLEGWAEQIQTALSPGTGFGTSWYLRVTAVSIDVDLGMVEATVAVVQKNVFTTS